MRHLTAALLFAALAACSNNKPADITAASPNNQSVSRQELGRSFSMKIGESITVGELRLTFRAVENDSRCPTDVVCVWAGDGEIALKIEQGSKAAVAALHTTLDPKKTEWDGYTIALVSLAPERKSNAPVSSADYRAEILVTR
ncbi:MAG TPA: hypothetical protein VFW03_05280 [Gemmatimonadaceae bacterium]|nr:hypothetical protein [Gemmatimonadaceae bacterium]